jgi:hypothetical protein
MKNKRSSNNLDHFMVIPLGAPEVADLVHHCLESVVHCLWIFSFVEDEPTEFFLDCFPLGDLCDFIPFMHRFEDVLNLFDTLQPLNLVVLLSTQGSEEYGGDLVVEVPHLCGLIGVIVLITTCGAYAPNSTMYQILSWSEVRWCLILSLHIQ